MARTSIKSQQIIIDQLSAQVAELTTQVGILMSQLEASNQARAALQDERDDLVIENQRLVDSCVAAHERCDALEAIVASTSAPQSQRQAATHKSLPSPAVVDASPTIEITDLDRAMWRKFQSLPRETRLEIIAFARPQWGHVGIHNIVEIRAAWHNAKPVEANSDELTEQELGEIYGCSMDRLLAQYDPDVMSA